MGIRFLCPTCGHRLNVKSFLAGKRGVCPQCGAGLDIPLDSQVTKGGSTPTTENLADVAVLPSSPAPAGSPRAEPKRPADAVPSLSDAAWLNDMGTSSPAPNPSGGAVGRFPDVPGVDTKLGAMGPRPPDSPGNGAAAPAAPVKPADAVPPAVPMRPVMSVPPATSSAPATPPAVPMPGVGTPQPVVPMSPKAAAGTPQPMLAGPPSVPMPVAVVAAPVVAAPLDPIQEAPDAIWYVRPPSGGQYGPARGDILRKWIGEGRVSHDSLVWREGWNDWRTAGQVFSGLGLTGAPPAPVMPVSVAYAPTSPRPASARPSYPSRRRNSLTLAVATVAVLAVMSVGLLIVLAWLLSAGKK
jgi:hypothetical protein